MGIVRFCVQFSRVLTIFVGKNKERMRQLTVNHCKNLKMSYEFDENFDVIVVVLVTPVWKLAWLQPVWDVKFY